MLPCLQATVHPIMTDLSEYQKFDACQNTCVKNSGRHRRAVNLEIRVQGIQEES